MSEDGIEKKRRGKVRIVIKLREGGEKEGIKRAGSEEEHITNESCIILPANSLSQ